MIPPYNCVRYVGTPEFNTQVARIVVDCFVQNATGVMNAGTVSADYQLMIDFMTRYLKIMNREKDEDLCVETVATVTKYWINRGWGKDLMADPRYGTPFKWKVAEKAEEYRNRDGILPPAESNGGVFPEFRPYGSIPGTMRLFKGKSMWWVTDNGTHGSTAECRQSPWWVWSNAGCRWHKWTIQGTGAVSGVGQTGGEIVCPTEIDFDRSEMEKYVIKMMQANVDSDLDDKHFTSKQLWHDAGVMLAPDAPSAKDGQKGKGK